MSDEQTLLAVLVVIYLADCVYWVPRTGLSVTRWIGPTWKLRFPSAILGNQMGAIGFANPLPPLGVASRCGGLGLETGAVVKRVTEFDEASRTLRALGNILFVFLFGICPAVVWRFGIVATLLPLVGGIYLQTFVIAWHFRKAHKRLYPGKGEDLFKPLLTMALAAPSAIRAQDILGRWLLEEFHPLAVAKALCSGETFKNYATTVVRDLRYPPGNISAAARAQRETLLAEVSKQFQISDEAPPKATDSAHQQYCPRCLQQFTASATSCADCGGRALVELAA